MCRAGVYGGLQVAAHPGGEPGGVGVVGDELLADLGEPRERGRRVLAEGRDGHQPAQPEHARGVDRGGQRRPGPAGRRRTVPSASGRVEADLQQHVDLVRSLLGAAASAGDQLGPVDRLDDVGVRRDRGGLVALQAADEVPGQPEVGALGGLGLGLLVAVLPHVGDAEVGQQPHVGGGEELGDHHEADVVGRASGVGAGRGDAAADGVEVGGELVGARQVLAHDSHTRPGEPAGGGAVAAVGVERRRPRGCSRPRRPTSTPAASSWARTPAPRSSEGVPHVVSATPPGTAAPTSARIASGTS